jgi:hypothetical protein
MRIQNRSASIDRKNATCATPFSSHNHLDPAPVKRLPTPKERSAWIVLSVVIKVVI